MPSSEQTTPPPDAFIRALSECQSALRGYCQASLGHGEAAKEAWQRTNVVLWRKANDWNVKTPFLRWALAVARFEVRATLRDLARERLVFDSDGRTSPLTSSTSRTLSASLGIRRAFCVFWTRRPMKRNLTITKPIRGPRVHAAPARWKESCAHSECSLHQLSPYIGKIKSSIAAELVDEFSRAGELVVDPFAGAGTIPLEAALRGRRSLGADVSAYARILSQAKLSPPVSLEKALISAEKALAQSRQLPQPDLRRVPAWVRRFFHPDTLREALRFAEVTRGPGNEFLMACFLGILHHQRPGFLSYPSSHLVPYLRDKKYPRSDFPEMYTYRELRSRLLAKVRRSFKRAVTPPVSRVKFIQTAVEELRMPKSFDALITSPPYMNALDYGRDNRLRLWFIEPSLATNSDSDVMKRRAAFVSAINSLAGKVETGLRSKGYCVFVVGEEFNRSFSAHPAEAVIGIMATKAPSLKLLKILADKIPDVRRTRRECKGVKTEHVLVFQRN